MEEQDRGDEFPMYGTVNNQLAGLDDLFPTPTHKTEEEFDSTAIAFIILFFGVWGLCGLIFWALNGFPMPW